MHDHDDNISNPSLNRPFTDVLEAYHSRRKVLSGGLGAVTTFVAGGPLSAMASGLAGKNPAEKRFPNGLMSFDAVPVEGGGGKTPRISADYRFNVLIPWGEPLFPGSAESIGIGHDGMTFFPIKGRNNHGLLTINHEFGDNSVVIGKNTPENLQDVEKSQYAHGVSVVEIARLAGKSGKWVTTNTGNYARRIHVNTPVEFSGPVAGSALLDNPAGNHPKGTVNNCANGATPWGTYLTCEENFNGYFGAANSWSATPEQKRYGFSADGFGYGWHLFDERFDLSNPDYINEDKRFGWIVEIDPMNADAAPIKRTALGRFKHEGIAITTGRGGRVVGYMGDDERFDYIYKFVSSDNWQSMQARNQSPLDHGQLFVARFNEDGSGDWLELDINNPVLSAEFDSQAEVLTFARKSADLLGATPMDRPEWTTVAPNGLVYCTLTNNSRRSEANAANPLTPNPDGHIIRWLDSEDHVGLTFQWEIFILAESTHGTETSFASPDGLWADPDGRLFIETDGRQKDGLNDQLLVADIYSGEIRRLFEGVRGAEVTGLAITPDRKTLFCNLQHPDPDTAVPRDATIVITRNDGGVVGS